MMEKEIFETHISTYKRIQKIVDEIFYYMLENYKEFFKIEVDKHLDSWHVIDDYLLTKKDYLIIKFYTTEDVNTWDILEIPVDVVCQNKWKTFIKAHVNKLTGK